jgi:hypothetical protein
VLVLLILSLLQHNPCETYWEYSCIPLNFGEPFADFTHLPFTIYYFGINYGDSRVYDENAISSVSHQILFLITTKNLSPSNQDLLNSWESTAAIKLGTVLLALLHVAIAPVYFFFELLGGS